MEGTQTARKRRKSSAVIAVLAAAALFCVGRPASAQPLSSGLQVAPNGVGDLLIFQYWTTVNRDTLIAIVNPFGPTQVGEATANTSRFVHVRVREGVASRDLLDFTICLSPGDVWTAAITPSGADASLLAVGNPGSCDGQVGAFGFTAPPNPGQQVGLPANFGYIEAYTMECSRQISGVRNCAVNTGNNNGGDDSIMGIATPINAQAGFSSSYNAAAIVGFDALNESASVLSGSGDGTRRPGSPLAVGVPALADLNPCPLGVGCRSSVSQAIAREGGVDKEMFLARWTASPDIDSSTQLVFTFPGGFQPGQNDPVSVWVWDENENFNFSPRSVVLPWEVNRCNLENGLNTASGNTELLCDGNAGPLEIAGAGGTFTGGWLRIINNNTLGDGDALGDDTGAESDSLDAPPDSRFPALALAFSFFEGIDGMFDQSYPVQWAAVLGAGGLGGPFCNRSLPGFPSGCASFNIPSSFSPWRTPEGTTCTFQANIPIPGGAPISDILADLVPGLVGQQLILGSNLCVPGDNASGAEQRTGTAAP